MISLQSEYSRRCAVAAVFLGACTYLWGCGARSGMLDRSEDDSPRSPGAGGAQPMGGNAGASVTTGATSSAGGAAGDPRPLTGGAGGTLWAGGAGGTRSAGGAGGTMPQATGGTIWAGGGAGGMRRTGGAGGTMPQATGGTGGGFVGSCAYPSCLWNLIRDCAVVGPCTQDDAQLAEATTFRTELCCRNGVNELVTMREQGSRILGTVVVSKNGSKCYDVSLTSTGDGSTLNYVWLDPSGQAVAKATILLADSSTPTVWCATGESMEMTDQCAPDGSQDAEISTGACP